MPLSTKQMEYLALAWQCFETEPKIDYEKFKTVAGLASAASARELMRVTKKKLKEEYGALSGSMTAANGNTVGGGVTPSKKSTPRTPASKRPRGKKAASEVNGENGDGDDDEDYGDDTPVAKRSKTPASAAKKSGKKSGSGSSNGVMVKHEPEVAGGDDDSDGYL
ncbi:hypothetical protein CB0940_05589 [Cercospora beticola]|uniref:Uncharacterized protein n=2 Tax=Cercospora beticola TaxID=122368 RepID=A0A2G5HZV4_CERBT|nr:hypothetical protein CB0940_05589 [Cercospora beticola]PIA97783.1 hypothetical protein CB0940_05589 [Cercospora beticola]CAK1359369.1 unnamed protein product [Cercospora beticola]